MISKIKARVPLLLITIFVFLNTDCNADSIYDNEYNHFSGSQINKFKVCGERCSGTNFVRVLVDTNFPRLKHSKWFEYGHKHFLWWFGSTDFERLKPLNYNMDIVNMTNSSNCLFIVVVRDCYDWLRSFFKTPWYIHEDLLNSGFPHFLRSEWKLMEYVHITEGDYKAIDNSNPWTNKPFSNVLELRKYKILNYLNLSNMVNNYLFVRYEDVRDHPKEFINFLARKYRLQKKGRFTPITTHKDTALPYNPSKYFSIAEEDLSFINANIDWEVEAKVGYYMKDEVE